MANLELYKAISETVLENSYCEKDFLDEDLTSPLSSRIVYIPVYNNKKYPGSTDRCLMRKTACKRLSDAVALLPDGFSFLIFDAWRPLEVQKYLFSDYAKIISKKNPGIKDSELHKLVTQFVSVPSEDHGNPPAHTTGGAVDLTIIDASGTPLDMGSEFDDFSHKAYTDFFEINDIDDNIRKNRRLLYNVMIGAGFTNLPSEWWHFDYGDRYWSIRRQKPEIYSGIFSIK